MHLALIALVGKGVTTLLYLTQSIRRRAVQLELENIDMLVGFHHAVHPSLARLPLRVNRIDAYQAKNQVKCVVEITFTLSLVRLAAHAVGDA